MSVTTCFLLSLLLAVAGGQRGFFAQMGDLMLDVDQDLTRMFRGVRQRLSPSSRQVLSQLNSNTENFMQSMDRINENILKGISTRVDIPDLVEVNVENQRQPIVDVSVPLLPLRVRLNPKPIDSKGEQTKITPDSNDKLNDAERRQYTRESEVNADWDDKKEYLGNENPVIVDEFPISERSKLTDSTHDFVYSAKSPEETDIQYYTIEEKPTKRSGSQTETDEVLIRDPHSESTNGESISNYDNAEDSGVSGRFLGNFLYSESSFDNMMKRLIRNHGRWSMDSNLIPSRTLQTLRRITNSFLNPVSDEYDRGLLNRHRQPYSDGDSTRDEYIEESEYLPDAHSTMYDRDERYDDWSSEDNINQGSTYLRPENEDLQLGLQEYQHVTRKLTSRTNFQSGSNNREVAILAFALDGTPVKIIIDSYIEDPLRYSHIVLRQQGVTLNFPVDVSGREPVPFEADVLRLGRNIGLPRVLRLDLTENEEDMDSGIDPYRQ